MSVPTRFLATFLAFVLLLLSAAAMVYEVAVATVGDATRQPPGWWTDMVTGRSLLWGGTAALAAGLVAAVCLIALVRLFGAARRRVDVFRVGEPAAQVTITRSALENLLGGALPARIPEIEAVAVALSERGGSVAATVLARASGCDLAALHGRVAALATEELEHAGGPGLAVLRLEIVEIVSAGSHE